MKKLLAFILIVLPLGSFASIISFHCKSTNAPGVHQFDARGMVEVDDYNKAEGTISLKVQKAQAPDSVQIFEEINVYGTRLHFEAGKVATSPFDQLSLTSKDPYIKNLNLFLDLNVENASEIFSVDNFHYHSTCEIESTL